MKFPIWAPCPHFLSLSPNQRNMSTSSSSSSAEGGEDGGDFEGPSSSRTRMRASNGVWPEPFLEALNFRLAADASHTIGRLAAAQSLSNLFQVCSTWRAISSSDLLWQNLTRNIWNIPDLVLRQSWREEYIYRHRTAANFRSGRYNYTTLHFVPTDNNNNDNGLNCRRLALSEHHLAAGFSDGAVHLFHIPSRLHLSTFYPQHRDRLGRFSSAVSGIILSDRRLIFATLDGDIHMAVFNAGTTPLRRAHLGDVVNDGALVDFAGCSRWWVGLYAGIPGRAFHIWNGETEELVFIGGTLTDPEAVMGWHLLTEMAGVIGRIRVANDDVAVACTGVRVIVFHLQNRGVVLEEEEFRRGIIVGSFDAFNGSALIPDARGVATVRRVADMEEVCRFTMMGGASLGCMNGGYGVTWGGGVIRVYGIENGEYLYSFRERIEECSALVADERYVTACCADDATIHLWDFEAQ